MVDAEATVRTGDIEYTALPQRKRRRGGNAAGASGGGGADVASAGGAAAGAQGAAAGGQEGGEAGAAAADAALVAAAGVGESRAAYNFEYLDHTADVQLHSWGSNLEAAFEDNALAMFNYMTPLDDDVLRNDEHHPKVYRVSAHDLHSLLFAFLDEALVTFATELYVPTNIKVTKLDREQWSIEAVASGIKYVDGKHLQGTEVKAITYSAMKVEEKEGRADVWCIVDI